MVFRLVADAEQFGQLAHLVTKAAEGKHLRDPVHMAMSRCQIDLYTPPALWQHRPRGVRVAGKDIVLVHGIRTHAGWFETVRRVFRDVPDTLVHPIKYGRFDLIRFLLPGPWRKGPKNRIKSKLLPILLTARSSGREITIICHSNGTKAVVDMLLEEPTFRIQNLIMCGSVVPDDFDWNLLTDQISGKIINDYGVRDIWPAVARSVTWGYGYSGTNGFGSPVVDRMHDATHSSYFERDFVARFWLPFIAENKFVDSDLPDDRPLSSPAWFGILEFPFRWLFAGLLAALIVLVALRFGSVGDLLTAQLPAPSIGTQGWVYYEVDSNGRPTEVGRLSVRGRSGRLPEAAAITPTDVLVTIDTKPLRSSATRNSWGRHLSAGTCLIPTGRRRSFQPANARSAAWFAVSVSACKAPQ